MIRCAGREHSELPPRKRAQPSPRRPTLADLWLAREIAAHAGAENLERPEVHKSRFAPAPRRTLDLLRAGVFVAATTRSKTEKRAFAGGDRVGLPDTILMAQRVLPGRWG